MMINDVDNISKFLKDNGYIMHHTAWTKGYISRKPDKYGNYGWIEKYSGRFGNGYKWFRPSYESTIYSYVSYYVKG